MCIACLALYDRVYIIVMFSGTKIVCLAKGKNFLNILCKWSVVSPYGMTFRAIDTCEVVHPSMDQIYIASVYLSSSLHHVVIIQLIFTMKKLYDIGVLFYVSSFYFIFIYIFFFHFFNLLVLVSFVGLYRGEPLLRSETVDIARWYCVMRGNTSVKKKILDINVHSGNLLKLYKCDRVYSNK
jgi:hypothetical protein